MTIDGDVWNFKISPDSARVVYWGDQQTDTVTELYSAPIAGGGSVKLNGLLVADGDVASIDLVVNHDSDRIVNADGHPDRHADGDADRDVGADAHRHARQRVVEGLRAAGAG